MKCQKGNDYQWMYQRATGITCLITSCEIETIRSIIVSQIQIIIQRDFLTVMVRILVLKTQT